MNKILIIILGLLAGWLCIFFVDELFKMLSSIILLKENTSLAFNGFKLNVILPGTAINNLYAYTAVLATPFLVSILFIESSLLWLNRTLNELARSFNLIFQLVNIGYLIASILITILSVFIKLSLSNDWQQLLSKGNLSYNQGLLLLLVVTVMLLSYINLLTKRIKKSIPAISRK